MAIDVTDLERALVSGGDDRIALDAATGLNMYGYGAVPRAVDLAFGSSTGSSISPVAFAELQATWSRMAAVGEGEAAYRLYAAGMDSARQRLLSAVGLSGEADVIFAASGTDAHLIATLLFAGLDSRPLTTIGVPGRTYTLQTASSLVHSQWTTLGSVTIPAALGITQWSEPLSAASAFYRLSYP